MTVPALVASTPDEIACLPMEQRGAIITQALEESKSWLAVATKGTDPTPIAEFKAWAATVAEMTRQKGLAQDIQEDALEMVRRAERGIGVAIRNGQEAGEIRKHGEVGNGRGVEIQGPDFYSRRRPTEAAGVKHPSGLEGAYSMTDGITDEEFEESLTEARAEHNLSRANVARKAQGKSETARLNRAQKADKIRELAEQGYSSRQMAGPLDTSAMTVREIARDHEIDIRADRLQPRSRQINPRRVVEQTVFALEGVRSALELLEPDDLDELPPSDLWEWLKSLNESMRALRQLTKEIKNHVES
jgi:hypothetical protein